jgi:serine/threonine-protein kinase
MASNRTNLKERYELRDVLGRGGMGVVYRAIDTLMKREVALKTILDVDNPASAELFYKEWSVLATMVHPNVIGIYDIGEFEEEGMKKPFFVMPMLPGLALDRLIRDGSPRLNTENVVNIIDQACRGLHAAHELGLIHRDVKPSNIFVMDDDSVKIIDFGIARPVSQESKTSVKGTLFYLAPECLEFHQPTALSDQYALAVTAYEALTRRRPFDGASESEVFVAIRSHSAPAVSELNPNVSYAISQVIHKAMAKQPYHRFLTIKDFGEALQKARRNEPLDLFDSSKIKPRLEKARTSFEKGDYNFALEILTELETEGRLEQDIGLLRRQVDQAVRQTRIRQLLESARRFWEAAEHPLALRKIQEALDLDPGDTSALSLKAQFERERREKKIEEWIQIARQHLDNQAFGQARDALNSVLSLKPNETVALELMAEAGRREREVSRAREEKARCYQAAMQAWDKGDVTSALGILESLMKLDRDLPEADAGRTGTYHNFYNQVHSEHNAIKSAYEEARQNLTGENYEAALTICRQYLAKYPNHALFQALEFDIQERQRQALSALIAETDRRVEAEADLHRRVGILEEVLKLYPGEPHFERALKLVRDKRDLVNSIVSKARYFEERGQINEALDQWQILRSIHERHPGLTFEIDRLIKRRDQQAREHAKATWVLQTDRCLEAGEYERAVRTVERALEEFPGEPDLLALGNVAGNALARSAEALELLARARELVEKGDPEASLGLLRQAAELDPRNTVIRTVLANLLVEDARRLIQTPEWQKAEPLLTELEALDPNHPGMGSLASEIADRKREGFISLCITHARRFQAEGDISRALSVVAQGLQAYPNDPRMEQLQATLQRVEAEVSRPPAARDTRDIKPDAPPPAETPEAIDPAALSTAPTLAFSPTPSGGESATAIFAAPAPAAAAAGAPAAAPKPASAAPAPPAAAPPPPKAKPSPKAGATTPAAPAPAAAPGRKKPFSSRDLMLAGAALSAVMAVIVVSVTISRSRTKPPPPVSTFKVVVRSSPEGAEIKIDGKPCAFPVCEMNLPAGSHHADATLNGYQPASVPFSVPGEREVHVPLLPPPAQFALSTDLTEGTVLVDKNVVAQIQGAETEVPRLTPGPHLLEVTAGEVKTSISLDFPNGALPKMTAPIQAQGIHAVLVTLYGSQAMVYTDAEGVPVMIDGKTAGTAGAAGLELKDLAAGPHEIQMMVNVSALSIPFESSANAGIVVYLRTERKLVSLRVVTGEDDVAIFLNGQKNKRTTTRGRLQLYLPPKQYTVHIEKPGLYAADQNVELRMGEESRLTFQMVPAKGKLEIRGAPAGVEVLLDNSPIGTVQDGGFSSPIEPGKHTVSLRKEGFRPFRNDYQFEIGKTITIDAPAMETSPGTLNFEVTPSGVEGLLIRVVREGESQERPAVENQMSVQPGTYRVTATAPQYQEAVATVTVGAGRAEKVLLPLRRLEKAPVPVTRAPSGFSMEDWVKLTDSNENTRWKHEGQLWTKQGGDFVTVPVNPAAGNFSFTAIVLKGKRLEWFVNWRDAKNYDLYQLEDKSLTRTRYADGKKTGSTKTQQSVKIKNYVILKVAVTAASVVSSLYVDNQWHVIDKFDTAGGGLQGKFGFHLQGSDQIGISEFRFTPN